MKRFYEVIQDEAGNIVIGAEVYIRDQDDDSLVTLYSDNGVTTTANPVVSGSDGYVSCWTADNVLKIEVVIDGELEKTIQYWQHFDAEDNEIKALRSVTSAANKGFYFTGAGTGAVYDLTSYGRSLGGAADAAAAATLLGLGTGDSPQFTAINLGHASDTTLARSGAGDVTIEGNAIYRAGGTDVPVADGGTGASTAAGARTNLGLGTIATLDEATAAQYRNNTADKALTTDQVWSAADYVALSESGGNVAVDLNNGLNFSLTMTGNWTLSNPTNTKNGQTGEIIITQDGTGSRTLAYGSNWKFAGGSDPVLSTAASSVDVLSYKVVSSTFIIAALAKGFA